MLVRYLGAKKMSDFDFLFQSTDSADYFDEMSEGFEAGFQETWAYEDTDTWDTVNKALNTVTTAVVNLKPVFESSPSPTESFAVAPSIPYADLLATDPQSLKTIQSTETQSTQNDAETDFWNKFAKGAAIFGVLFVGYKLFKE